MFTFTTRSSHLALTLFALLFLGATLVLPAAPAAAANTIEVTTLADTEGVDGGCSLREAIKAANERRAVNECPPGGPDTLILLPLLLPEDEGRVGIMKLSSCLPRIEANVTFRGLGTAETPVIVDAQGTCRVFFVERGQVRFENLIIRGGLAKGGDGGDGAAGGGGGGGGAGMGGGIFINGGDVALNNVRLEDNVAEGGRGGNGGYQGNGGGGGGGGAGGFTGAGGGTATGGNGGGGGYLFSDANNGAGGGRGGVRGAQGDAGAEGSGGGGGGGCSGDNSGVGGFGGFGAGGGGAGGCQLAGAGFGAAGGFGGGAGGAGQRSNAPSGGNLSVAYGGASGNGLNQGGGAGGGGAGLGGGVFIRLGRLVVNRSQFVGNQAVGGVRGNPGDNLGEDNEQKRDPKSIGTYGSDGGSLGATIFVGAGAELGHAGAVTFSDNKRTYHIRDNDSDQRSTLTIDDNSIFQDDRSTFNDNVPLVEVKASPAPVSPSATTVGAFTLTFDPALTRTTTISYTLGGTAIAGQFNASPGLNLGGGTLSVVASATNPVSSTTITIDRTPESNAAAGKTLVLSLAPDAAYAIGAKGSDELAITRLAAPWLVLLYLSGDDKVPSDSEQYEGLVGSLTEPLSRLVADLKSNLSPSDSYQLVVLYDGNQKGDSRLYVSDPQAGAGLERIKEVLPPQRPVWLPANGELDMGKVSTLQNFIDWAKTQYAGSRHSMLAIVNHGGGWAQDLTTEPQPLRTNIVEAGGWRGLSLDMDGQGAESAGLVGVSSLSTLNTGQVFAGLGQQGHFDVLFFDACLMGTLESLYEVRDYADYMIAGQNLLWAELPYRSYLDAIGQDTTPEALAAHIADVYNQEAPADEPFVIAGVQAQGGALDRVRDRLEALASLLYERLADPATRPEILDLITGSGRVYADVQKFDYNADLEIDQATDGYVDLAHFAWLVSQRAPEGDDLRTKAMALYRAIVRDLDSPDAAVLDVNPRPGKLARLGGEWNFDNANGLSIYLPLGEQDCRPTGLPSEAPPEHEFECGPDAQEAYADYVGSAGGPPLLLEDQLNYYLDSQNLSLVRHAPSWARFLKAIRHQYRVPNWSVASLASSPFQVSSRVRVHLPLLAMPAPRPDLIGSIRVASTSITAGQRVELTAIITNTGSAAARPFWVDLYINPTRVPRQSDRWPQLCAEGRPCYGVAWEVPAGLEPGKSTTLVATIDADGPQTVWPGCFNAGTQRLYLYVDSWDPDVAFGRVEESNEANNMSGPVTIDVLPSPTGATCSLFRG